MIRRNRREARAKQRVRAGGIHLQLVKSVRRTIHIKTELQTLRFTYPVLLHRADFFRPVWQIVQKELSLKYIARTGHGTTAKNIGIAIQSALKDIGIKMDVVQVESFGDIVKKGEFDLVWERWTAAPGNDPESFLKSSFQGESVGNRGKYSNPAIERRFRRQLVIYSH